MEFNHNPQNPQQDDSLQDFLTIQDVIENLPYEEPISEDLNITDNLDFAENVGVFEDVGLSDDLELEMIIEEAKASSPMSGSTEFFSIPVADETLSQQPHLSANAEFDYTRELPNTDFAPMTEAAAGPIKEEPQKDEQSREASNKTPRKRRPEHKKGYGLFGLPHLLSTVVWLAIIVAIGVTLGRMIWVAAADMLAFNKPYVSAVITITDEDSLDDIVEDLEDAGLVRYGVLFKAFANIKGGREEFSSGTFTFTNDRLYDYNAIMNNVNPNSSAREVVEDLVIPEGYTCAQIFALLEEKGVCSVAELEEYCANGQIKDYWFLEGVTRGDKYCLEGYLFPNTYDFYKDDSPAHVIGKMLSSFDDNYTDVMIDKLEPLNQRLATILANRGYSQEYIDDHKITIREVIIIASMIERESIGGEERFKVSGVIYNRLTNPKEFPKLQIDATIIYALGGNMDENGNVKPLTKADLAMDHPYNSYVYDGLIPGPISNPGAASINAALDPNDEGYYFYVFDPRAGEHIFSKTAAEHEKAVNSVRD